MESSRLWVCGGGFVGFWGCCFFFAPFSFLDLGPNPPALEGEVHPSGGCRERGGEVSQSSMQNASHDF